MPDYSKKSSKKKTVAGDKAYQRDDKEDRSLGYRLFRRELGKSLKDGRYRKTPYTSDIDQVEFIFHDKKPIPVAVLEITRYDFDEYDGPAHSWAKYRQAILDRYFLRDSQGQFIQMISNKLGCEAWIVLFRHDLKAFWLFDVMHKDANWIRKTDEEYQEWLVDLRTKNMEKLDNECVD